MLSLSGTRSRVEGSVINPGPRAPLFDALLIVNHPHYLYCSVSEIVFSEAFTDQTYLNALVWEEMLTSLTSIHKKHGLCSSGEALYCCSFILDWKKLSKLSRKSPLRRKWRRRRPTQTVWWESTQTHSCAADYTHAVMWIILLHVFILIQSTQNTWSETEDQLQ